MHESVDHHFGPGGIFADRLVERARRRAAFEMAVGLAVVLGPVAEVFLTGTALGVAALTNPDTRVRGALTLANVVFFAVLLNAFAHFYARFWHVPLVLAMSLSRPRGAQSMYPYRLS